MFFFQRPSGDVFKANVKASGELAAVKIINIEPQDDFDVIQQEIIIMQDCHHINIVKYHGSYLRKVRVSLVPSAL